MVGEVSKQKSKNSKEKLQQQQQRKIAINRHNNIIYNIFYLSN